MQTVLNRWQWHHQKQGRIITIELYSSALITWKAPDIFPALHNIFSQWRRPPRRVEPTWKGILQTFSFVLFPQKSFCSMWYCTDYERLASINHKIEKVHCVCVWNIMNRFSLLFWHLPFKRQYGMPKINKIKGESYVLSILARELNRLNWFISSIPNYFWFLLHALLYWISSTDGSPISWAIQFSAGIFSILHSCFTSNSDGQTNHPKLNFVPFN